MSPLAVWKPKKNTAEGERGEGSKGGGNGGGLSLLDPFAVRGESCQRLLVKGGSGSLTVCNGRRARSNVSDSWAGKRRIGSLGLWVAGCCFFHCFRWKSGRSGREDLRSKRGQTSALMAGAGKKVEGLRANAEPYRKQVTIAWTPPLPRPKKKCWKRSAQVTWWR